MKWYLYGQAIRDLADWSALKFIPTLERAKRGYSWALRSSNQCGWVGPKLVGMLCLFLVGLVCFFFKLFQVYQFFGTFMQGNTILWSQMNVWTVVEFFFLFNNFVSLTSEDDIRNDTVLDFALTGVAKCHEERREGRIKKCQVEEFKSGAKTIVPGVLSHAIMNSDNILGNFRKFLIVLSFDSEDFMEAITDYNYEEEGTDIFHPRFKRDTLDGDRRGLFGCPV